MTDRDEWGPWIEHDGKGCPCVGRFVHLEMYATHDIECVAGAECKRYGRDVNGPLSAWVWDRYHTLGDVIRYRIRRPRALLQLIEMVENLPAPVRESEPA